MDQEQFIQELFDLAEATRRLAERLAEPGVSRRLADIADAMDALARAEGRISRPPDFDRLQC